MRSEKKVTRESKSSKLPKLRVKAVTFHVQEKKRIVDKKKEALEVTRKISNEEDSA